MTDCHACGSPMPLDQWGHPVHDGPCPGPDLEPQPLNPRRCHTCSRTHFPKCDGTRNRRWPVAPLRDFLTARFGCVWNGGNGHTEGDEQGYTHQRASELLGIAPGTWKQMIARRFISEQTADELAVRLGEHPSRIWGWAWFEAALRPADERFLASGWRQVWEWNEIEQTQIGSDNKQERAA